MDSPKYDKNLFAYCDNNPISRVDHSGEFWDTLFDIGSLIVSVVDVIKNPSDPMAWASLAADAVCLATPGLTGGGAMVKAVTNVDDVVDVVKTVNKVDNFVDTVKTVNKVDKAKDTVTASIKYTDKVLKQMDNTADLNHSFPLLIDTMVDLRTGKPLTGGDGITRNLIQIPGEINGREGFFEYIIEPNGLCNHRFFRGI